MIESIFGALAAAASIVVLLPVLLLAAECAAAGRRQPRRSQRPAARPAATVIVPAHDEAAGIVSTVRSVRAQMRPDDRLLVVADNCVDDTASLAAAAGADVLVRIDPARRGKGYALDAGLRHLGSESTNDVIVFVDADCQLGDGALDYLSHAAAATGRPVQGRYLITAPPKAPPRLLVAELAFAIKNRFRLKGLAAMGLPCPLTGSGMAFPKSIIMQVPLASAHLVEDMKLGLDLAHSGHPPAYCDEAVILSQFPTGSDALAAQQRRWEAGRSALTRTTLTSLLDRRSLLNWHYLFMILDLMIPPLTQLMVLLMANLILSLSATLVTGTIWPLALSCLSLLALAATILGACIAQGRRGSLRQMLGGIWVYFRGKLAIRLWLLRKPHQLAWIRTERDRSRD